MIDLAASSGGNVYGVQQNIIHHINGITLYGNSQLAADMPVDASKVYGKNLHNFLQLIISKEGTIQLNFEDDIVKGCCVVHNGAVVHDRILSLINN